MDTDDPNAYGASWYSATRVAAPPRGRLTVELDVDVCVIGAGLAGLTVALEVARLGWSVVVLEAQGVAWSASGRNTGVVLPGFAVSASALVERAGLDHAKALWARSEAGAEYVRSAAREMEGVALSEGGWLHVSRTDNPAAMASLAALLAGKFGAAVEPWPAGRVREALRSPHYFHALHHPRGFSLHPLNYALGLAAAAEVAGARIFEDTPVAEIDPAGVRKRVVTRYSRVRAGHVVLAGNVHLPALVPQFSSTLTPVFSTVVVTAPLGGELHDAIRFPGAVSDTGPAGPHHRVVDGGRLMWSGRGTVWLGKPQRHADALMRQAGRVYPQLRGAKAEYAWTGASGSTVHGMPQIGEISPGLWLVSGFGGHGLNTTAMAGEIVARAIVEGDTGWKLFSPFALVWAGGTAGRAAQQVSGWAQRAGEELEGALARRRDARRRRAEAAKAAAVAPVPVVSEAPPLSEPAPEPLPAAAAQEVAPDVLEGWPGGAAPAIPDATDSPGGPVKPRRKRGKKRRDAAPTEAPAGGTPSGTEST
ncbi:MAG: FAD-binding oxidoreductase [Xanthobacteraceae bacterium]|nr:FAD-binding oxidoreductase [Xanthobacteraceae bacterium]